MTPSNARFCSQTPATPLQDRVNDAAMQAVVSKIAALELELAKERAEKDQLAADLAQAQEDIMSGPDEQQQQREHEELWAELEAIQQELEDERQRAADLEQQVKEQLALSDARRNAPDNQVSDSSVLRPKGTAGLNWGIQTAMGLGGGSRKNEFYKGIQRQLCDLSMSAQLNWETSWSNIPTVDKAKFFYAARDKIPFLKQFHNNWATEEIVKQYFGNKRKNHYRNGWLDVPERYKHLKETSAKRNPLGSRVKRVKAARIAAQREGHRRDRTAQRALAEEQNEQEEDMVMD
ncbi:hypothetical protein H0H81_006154 [Sphagnurus paluster]|uniref:Uncharacterized protein n=1 Tax=Sphagnurus paluster TaxID=117069 RepID=A0A9P7GKT6_9AGAR|nr:hypothetical protein H0H81_006154 [Sphagnurus paluster]